MAAYVASARLQPGRPRLAATTRQLVNAADRPATTDVWLLDTSPPGQRELELRLEAIRDRWSQLWFFVLDPESWR
jgi:hypothetical protein